MLHKRLLFAFSGCRLSLVKLLNQFLDPFLEGFVRLASSRQIVLHFPEGLVDLETLLLQGFELFFNSGRF